MEAIIPIEIGMPTLRKEILEKANTEAIAKDLDMVVELHEAEATRMASYQQRMANLPHAFRAEDIALRKHD